MMAESFVAPVPTDAQRVEFAALRGAHQQAQDIIDRSPIGGTDAQVIRENVTWNAMVDWIEDNDLNYSELDPRGTREEYEATQ
jgi:hypothetical protein